MASEAFVTKQFFSEPGAQTAPLGLSLLLTEESLMYAISTNNFSTPVELCEIHFKNLNASHDATDKLTLMVNNYQLHQKKFQKVNLCILNQSFSMIPDAYADNVEVKNILPFSSGVAHLKTLHHQLDGLKFYFGLNTDLFNYLERSFPNASIRHSGAVLISLFLSHRTFVNTDILLHVGEGVIEIVVKKNKALQFYNVFNCAGNEDILYYLLFTMEQFSLDPLTVRLSVAAERAVNDELFKSVKNYIKQVEFCVSDQTIQLKSDLSRLPQHYYFTLLNQHLCEL